MSIEGIELLDKYEDTLGKTKEGVKGKLRRIVTITNKTSNSIEFKDEKGYISWITLEDFCRVERQVNKVRFVKTVD